MVAVVPAEKLQRGAPHTTGKESFIGVSLITLTRHRVLQPLAFRYTSSGDAPWETFHLSFRVCADWSITFIMMSTSRYGTCHHIQSGTERSGTSVYQEEQTSYF